MNLSLCIIAKDEEKNIEKLLESVRGVCNEIIFVDSGSKDRTLEIARKYTNKIYETTFNDDFSELRNLALDKATGDYILFLDGDEVLDKESGEELVNYLESNKECYGVYFRIENIIGDKSISSASVFRCFKNLKMFRFERNIHEQVLPSIVNNIKEPNFYTSNFKVFHYGYDPDAYNIEEKSRRNIRLLNKFSHEKDSYYYYIYGNELVRIDRLDEAIELYEKAIDIYNKNYIEIYVPYLIINLQRIYIKTKRFSEAYSIYNKYKEILTDFKDLYFTGAVAVFGLKKYKLAKEILNQYKNIESRYNVYPECNLNLPEEFEKDIDNFIISEKYGFQREGIRLNICILTNGNKAINKDFLFSLRYLKCKKYIFTNQEYEDGKSFDEIYDIKWIKFRDDIGGSCSKLNYVLTYMGKFINEGEWILLLNEHESINNQDLSSIINLISIPYNINGVVMNIIKDKKIISKDLRLYKYNKNLCYVNDILPTVFESFKMVYPLPSLKYFNLNLIYK